MTIYGYARVSTIEQNLDRQIAALEKEGCEVIYTDKQTGTNTDRPNLQQMLDELQEGDLIIIKDLTRFSRSTRDLFFLVDQIKEKKAALKSINDSWLDISEDNPFSKMLLMIMAALSEYEWDLMKERQREGIAQAKKRGVYKGRPKTFTENNPRVKHALDMYESGEGTVRQVCAITNISEATFYRNLKRRREEREMQK